ncbi:MAG: DUF998 domain-containing protein [Desulfurococcales archaeon]|nr:DUF998 domain-containing protein [Desulfurococcales archaeon]
MGNKSCILGIIAAVFAWVVIGVSWSLNPWFDFFKHAFSDLGTKQANMPWVYNYGLIATGVLIILYSICTYRYATNKMEAVGSGFLFIAGIFLALIGVYPGGTRPHVFVSTWFFVQMDMAIIAMGLGLLMRAIWRVGLAITLLGLMAFPVYVVVDYLVGWPSVAVGEAYGIIVIDIAVLLLVYEQIKH